jgi:hypothetical protein
MNRTIIIYLLAAIGLITLLICAIRITAVRFFPGYEAQAVEEFGDPEAIKAIAELYDRIEASPHDPALKEVDEHLAKFPKIRQVPRSWLPARFARKWGEDFGTWRKVLAFYDDSDKLVGIEFFGSRYGCFASRDATRCPSWYSSLRRIAEQPIYVTARFSVE